MNNEMKIEIKTPIFEKTELQFLDNNFENISRDYINAIVKEREQIIAQRIIKNQLYKIDELRNIIGKAINYLEQFEYDMETGGIHMDIIMGILRGEYK